jgi:hypothetical protein
MVGVINPNASTSIETQKELAQNSSFQLNPGEPWPAESASPDLPDTTVSSTSSASTPATSTGSTPATTSSESDSALNEDGESSAKNSLSSGAKAGIGVAAAAVILGILVFALLWYKRRRRNPAARPAATVSGSNKPEDHHEAGFQQKPELHGGPFNAAIAGLVRKKGELGSGIVRSKAPHLPELEGKPRIQANTHEISSSDHGSSNQGKTTATDSSTITTQVSRIQTNSLSHPISEPHALSPSFTKEQTEEIDLLVSELGILMRRKKALAASAEASNLRPEDVEGEKGEDYRDLNAREQRLRVRLEELRSKF